MLWTWYALNTRTRRECQSGTNKKFANCQLPFALCCLPFDVSFGTLTQAVGRIWHERLLGLFGQLRSTWLTGYFDGQLGEWEKLAPSHCQSLISRRIRKIFACLSQLNWHMCTVTVTVTTTLTGASLMPDLLNKVICFLFFFFSSFCVPLKSSSLVHRLAAAARREKERLRCDTDNGWNLLDRVVFHIHQPHLGGLWQCVGKYNGREGFHHYNDADWR